MKPKVSLTGDSEHGYVLFFDPRKGEDAFDATLAITSQEMRELCRLVTKTPEFYNEFMIKL